MTSDLDISTCDKNPLVIKNQPCAGGSRTFRQGGGGGGGGPETDFFSHQRRGPIASWGESVAVFLNRGSYINAHVLLNLLNELGKRGKM